MQTIQTDAPTFRFTERGSNLANPLLNNTHNAYNMKQEYAIQFYKIINKLFCILSFARQYILRSLFKVTNTNVHFYFTRYKIRPKYQFYRKIMALKQS